MAIYDFPNASDGIDQVIVGTVTGIPAFTPMLLLFVFLTILLGGSLNQKRRVGAADMPMWATLAGIGTLLVALPLTMRAGIIQVELLSIVIVITIFSGLWLFLDRNRNEI